MKSADALAAGGHAGREKPRHPFLRRRCAGRRVQAAGAGGEGARRAAVQRHRARGLAAPRALCARGRAHAAEPGDDHGRARAASGVAQVARHSGVAGARAGRCRHDQGVRGFGEEVRRPHRRQARFQARHRSARARAEQSAAAHRAQPRLRRGLHRRRRLRFRPPASVPDPAGAAGGRRDRSRAGRLALDLGAQRRAAAQFALPARVERPPHGEPGLGRLDRGQDGGAGDAAHPLRRLRQAARVHPRRQRLRRLQGPRGQRAAVGPAAAAGGVPGDAECGDRERAGRGLSPSRQHARHARRRRAGDAVQAYK